MPSAADWQALYPFASQYLRLDNLRYHYLDEGAGPTLLFVHGNPTWSFYWRNLILGLRDEHRCLAVDHIGCGLSDKPQAYDYCLARHIDNLARFIEEKNLREITLLAHDWGGAIGLGAAQRTPDRFARLVLCNTAAFPPPFVPLRIRVCRTPWVGAFALRRLNLFSRAALRMAVEKPDRMTAAVCAGLLAPYDSWANRIAVARFVEDIPFTRGHRTWRLLEQIEINLSQLAHLPVQMIWGMKDWCFRPSCLERLATHFPHAEIHRLGDAGHYVIEDAHERIIPLVRSFVQPPAGVASAHPPT